jgi:hypothetical protein
MKIYRNKRSGLLSFAFRVNWKFWETIEIETPKDLIQFIQSHKTAIYRSAGHSEIAINWNFYNIEMARLDFEKFSIADFKGEETSKQVEVFCYEGCYFLGNFDKAVARYQKEKPSAKFFIWLNDHYLELKPLK